MKTKCIESDAAQKKNAGPTNALTARNTNMQHTQDRLIIKPTAKPRNKKASNSRATAATSQARSVVKSQAKASCRMQSELGNVMLKASCRMQSELLEPHTQRRRTSNEHGGEFCDKLRSIQNHL